MSVRQGLCQPCPLQDRGLAGIVHHHALARLRIAHVVIRLKNRYHRLDSTSPRATLKPADRRFPGVGSVRIPVFQSLDVLP